jgi:glycosidase
MVGNGEGGFGSTPDLMAEGPANSIDQQWIIDRLSMANAFLLTIPGIPLLYYGDEIGLAGDSDPDNRRMMQWDRNANQQALLERVRELGQIRQSMPALRYGSRQELWIDQDFYAFARDDGEHRALVAMNKAEDQRTETVTLPEDWSPTSTLVDQLSGASITASAGEVEIGLDPWGYAIFEVSP